MIAVSPGAAAPVVEAIERLGGAVVSRLDELDALVAEIPSTQLEQVAGLPGVTAIAPDTTVRLASAPTTAGPTVSLGELASEIGATAAWNEGGRGQGVDVALIDSGVAPLPGLAGRVVYGPDFSSEASFRNLAGLDGFGHGTHLASIIVGGDATTGESGLAPDARIVSVKVADHNGSTDLVAIMSALDWTLRNRTAKGFNIRVVNLAFGVDPGDPMDIISLAVQTAWRKGLIVVAAAGNGGPFSPGLDSPAVDPYVISVGAADTTGSSAPRVAAFSAAGDGVRNPDLLAPGVGLVGARVTNGALDTAFPQARVGDAGFRGQRHLTVGCGRQRRCGDSGQPQSEAQAG